jgi:hypothetical protein
MARLIVHMRPEFVTRYRTLRTESALVEHEINNARDIPGEPEAIVKKQQECAYKITDCGLDAAIGIWDDCRKNDPTLPRLFSSWMILGAGRVLFIDYEATTKKT